MTDFCQGFAPCCNINSACVGSDICLSPNSTNGADGLDDGTGFTGCNVTPPCQSLLFTNSDIVYAGGCTDASYTDPSCTPSCSKFLQLPVPSDMS